MTSIRYKFSIGQIVLAGNRKVIIEELREFWGKPSYMVSWTDQENNIQRAVLKESEIS